VVFQPTIHNGLGVFHGKRNGSDKTGELLNWLKRFGVSDGFFDDSALTGIFHGGWKALSGSF